MPSNLTPLGRSLLESIGETKPSAVTPLGKSLLESIGEKPEIETPPSSIDTELKNVVEKGTQGQFEQMAQEELNLPPALRGATRNSKLIDVLTGGMSLPEAEANARAQIERYKNIPLALKAATQPIKNVEDFVTQAGGLLGVAATPFIPAYQGVMGGLQKLADTGSPVEALKGAVRGAVQPESVPLWTGPERVPLTKPELEGGTTALIPRAIVNAIEQFSLGAAMGGGKSALKNVKSEYNVQQMNKVLKAIETDLPAIKEIVKKNNPDLPQDVIDNLTPQQVVQGAQENVSLADYVQKVQNRVSPLNKLGLSTEDVSLPEKIKIETDPKRVQEIKNSIAEGEMILKSGKTVAGQKMSEDALDAVKRSIDNAKAKIGEVTPPVVIPQIQPTQTPTAPKIVQPSANVKAFSPTEIGKTRPEDFATAEEYVASQKSKYQGVHKAPTREHSDIYGALHEIDKTYPSDIYTDENAWRYYGHGTIKDKAMDMNSLKIIRSVRGNLDVEITIYRSVPKGTQKEINPGDWVSINKQYVRQHGERFDEGQEIIEKKVKSGDIFTEGNSIHEFGYDPVVGGLKTDAQLTAEWEAAQKKVPSVQEVKNIPDFKQSGQALETPEQKAVIDQKINVGGADLPDANFDRASLEEGVAVESEHTNDPYIASKIAKSHLQEDPQYYVKLAKMENRPLKTQAKGPAVELPPPEPPTPPTAVSPGPEEMPENKAAQEVRDVASGRSKGFSTDVNKLLSTSKGVAQVGKILSKEIPFSAYKKIINSNVGLKRQSKAVVSDEAKLLKRELKQEEIAARGGYKTGRQEVRQEIREKKAAEKAEREAKKRFTPEQRKELHLLGLQKGIIYETWKGNIKNKKNSILSKYKNASYEEIKDYISALSGSKENPPIIFSLYGDIKADAEAIKMIEEYSNEWKDINKIETATKDPIRIIEGVSGRSIWDEQNVLADNTINVISSADALFFDELQAKKAELADKVKLRADTKASADAMRKAEEGLPLTAEEQSAVDYVRSQNEQLIKDINAEYEKAGMRPISYRQNYLTHMREYNELMRLFKGDQDKINNLTNEQLEAIRASGFSKPNAPYNPHAQKRTGEKTKYDLVGNYEKYLETMLRIKYMLPAIRHARKFSDYALLKFPNAQYAMTQLFNELSGKPSHFDSAKAWNAVISHKWLTAIRSRIAGNALVANLNFYLMNATNLATSFGELGSYAAKGAKMFLSDEDMRKLAFKHSAMLKSRREQFDADVKTISMLDVNDLKGLSAIEQAKITGKKLQYLVSSINRYIEYFNTGSTWCGAYRKAIEVFKYSPEKALKYADAIARRTQVGYRDYELPALMRSNTGKTFLMFQSWTFNAMNHILYDGGVVNIPKDIWFGTKKMLGHKFTEYMIKVGFDDSGNPIYAKRDNARYAMILRLFITTAAVSAMFAYANKRKPYELSSIVPRIPTSIEKFPVGKLATDTALAFTSKKPETRFKHGLKAVTSTVPKMGGVQISRWVTGKGNFIERSLPQKDEAYAKRDVVKMYVDAIKKDSKSAYDAADKEAKKNDLLISEMKDAAWDKIDEEVILAYEEAIQKDSKSAFEKADKLADSLPELNDEKNQDYYYDRALTRIENRSKKERERAEALVEQGRK